MANLNINNLNWVGNMAEHLGFMRSALIANFVERNNAFTSSLAVEQLNENWATL